MGAAVGAACPCGRRGEDGGFSLAEAASHKAVPASALRAAAAAYAENDDKALSPPAFLAPVCGGGPEAGRSLARLLARALEEFEAACGGECNVQVARSPARVNLRGMHIDNNGGYCNSICIDRETLIVFTTVDLDSEDTPLVTLWNHDERFKPMNQVVVSQSVGRGEVEEATLDTSSWDRYVVNTMRAARELGALGEYRRGLRGVVTSNIPTGAGLSSSHSFILCVLQALAAIQGSACAIDEVTEIKIAQRAEHLTGVKSGLMDQGSMAFGRCGSVLHARFYDLKIDEIPSTVRRCAWPKDAAVVVANSRVSRKLACSGNAISYALPRLGCAIAFPLLRAEAARKGLPAEDEHSWGLAQTLSLLKTVPNAATVGELLENYPMHKTAIEAAVERLIPGGREGLGTTQVPLRGSTLFVLAECARAKSFFEALNGGDLATCGRLMDVGHEGDAANGSLHMSDEDLEALAVQHASQGLSFIPGAFRAGHVRLDELCQCLRASGALGASLTGAGLGGCVVGLFATVGEADAAVDRVRTEFADLGVEDVFVAKPCAGRGLLRADF